jgi:hypothetical protein
VTVPKEGATTLQASVMLSMRPLWVGLKRMAMSRRVVGEEGSAKKNLL